MSTGQLALHTTPKLPGHRDTQVKVEGRIYDRWEPTPEGVERGTWGRAWIGVVEVSVRSDDPEAAATHLRTRKGEDEAQDAFIAHLLNTGAIEGDRSKISRDLWCCDAKVTIEDGRAVYRQEVEVPQDFGPEPTREEKAAGWLRLTGKPMKTFADVMAEVEERARAPVGGIPAELLQECEGRSSSYATAVLHRDHVRRRLGLPAVHDLGNGETGVVVVGAPAPATPPVQRGGRPGWTRLSPPGNKCATHWRHESGWEVRHCGHPTANYPYSATDPGDPEARVCVTHNGRGFKTLAVAFDAIDGVLAGRLIATNERCGARTRRICTPEQVA